MHKKNAITQTDVIKALYRITSSTEIARDTTTKMTNDINNDTNIESNATMELSTKITIQTVFPLIPLSIFNANSVLLH
ncbi:TPA: hypothetical protein H7V46_004728 [Escherichia coli]|nr:hypothetical protein [Escherichia coli]